MEIKEVTAKEEWEGFLMKCEEKTFLHSWQWGEFQRLMRGEVWRLGMYEGENLQAVCLVVKVAARRGTFLLVPHGIFELPAILFSIGIGFKIGIDLFSRKKGNLKYNLREALRFFIYIILPLLIIAAIIEGALISLSN